MGHDRVRSGDVELRPPAPDDAPEIVLLTREAFGGPRRPADAVRRHEGITRGTERTDRALDALLAGPRPGILDFF